MLMKCIKQELNLLILKMMMVMVTMAMTISRETMWLKEMINLKIKLLILMQAIWSCISDKTAIVQSGISFDRVLH